MKRKRFLTNFTGSSYLTAIIVSLLLLSFGSNTKAQNFSVPNLDFYEFGTEVTEEDRCSVIYEMTKTDSFRREGDTIKHESSINQVLRDSLLTLDLYDLCDYLCKNVSGGYIRSWDSRYEDSLTPGIQRIYAYGIKNARNRTDFIHFLLAYAERAPYDEEQTIGEYLISECSDALDDSLEYEALTYIVDGSLATIGVDDTTAVRFIYGLCTDKLAVAKRLFGEEDSQYYSNLLLCTDIASAPFIYDWDMIEKLFDYHLKYDRTYRDGEIENIFSDPMYGLYLKKLEKDDIDGAYNVLNILLTAANVDLTENNIVNNKVSEYGEAQIYLLYSKAQLDYWTGKNGYEEEMKNAYNLALKYLSPKGGFYGIQVFIRPDYRLLSDIISWLKVSYDLSDAGDVYNASLFLKGTVNNVASAILTELDSSEDDELREYADSLRNNYDKAPPWEKWSIVNTFSSPEYQKWFARESKFTNRLDSLDGPDSVTKFWVSCLIKWPQVRNSLHEDETAIEIVNNMPISGEEIEYKAIVLNKSDNKPVAVKLCTGSELRSILRSSNCYDTSSTKLFETIWKPIVPHIKGKVIHYSPIGILANINIAAVRDEGGRCLSDTYDIRTCSSTAWLAGRNEPEKFSKYERIELWGGSCSIPESEKEIKDISTIAEEYGVAATAHSGKKCTERSFRAISGSHVPIIHIAAHGFYYRATEQAEDEKDNPLDRCGILLEKEAYKAGMHENNEDDGILLGSEIARMNLVGTELVVLSACKSGLGDISGEGIIGLQRAFRLAGAKTVVATLGNVPDKATRVFMTEFYRSLFSGKTKRQAFNDAVSFMKSSHDYSAPKYWAQFVMID